MIIPIDDGNVCSGDTVLLNAIARVTVFMQEILHVRL